MVMDVEFGNRSHPKCESIARQPLQWPYSALRKSRSDSAVAAASLEDEITSLRRQMEDAFVQCHSFTSEPVMDISRKLDVKIYEYMRVLHQGLG
ncbi:hypothetical protein GCM10020370_14620 [Paenibacillus hodogayensis]